MARSKPTARSIKAESQRQVLDAKCQSNVIYELQSRLKSEVIGQEEACDVIAKCLNVAVSGIRDKEKPLATMLFLGSTGVGKTELVKVLSDIIFGNRTFFTRINCEELNSDHTFSKLIGSPPGYTGAEIEPMLSQSSLDTPFKQAMVSKSGMFSDNRSIFFKRFKDFKNNGCLSIILFDEIEKAHPKILQSLIGVMDDGHLTLGNNDIVDLTNCIIIMTSNIGSQFIDRSFEKKGMGFDIGADESINNISTKDEIMKEVREKLLPEFCNRLDKIVIFNSLTKNEFKNILDVQLTKISTRINLANLNLFLVYRDSFLDYLLEKGTSMRYGARNLNRVIQEELVAPLSNLINTEQIIQGDFVEVKRKNGDTIFTREARYNKNFIDLIKGK